MMPMPMAMPVIKTKIASPLIDVDTLNKNVCFVRPSQYVNRSAASVARFVLAIVHAEMILVFALRIHPINA